MDLKRLAIVVLNYNKYEDTIKCVRQLLDTQNSIYIVIVDNASTNDSFEILSKEFCSDKQVAVIRNNSNGGYAAGNNFGFRYAIDNYSEIDYVGIMNPDTLVTEKDVFESIMLKADSYKDVAVIAPIMLSHGVYDIAHSYWNFPDYSDIVKQAFLYYSKRSQRPLTVLPEKCSYVDVVHGSLFIIKKEALLKIDYLDESTFMYGEENILALRLKEEGYREMIDLEHFYQHNHGKPGKAKSLKAKLLLSNEDIRSREYTCHRYFNKKGFMLKIIKLLNNTILTLLYFKGQLKG